MELAMRWQVYFPERLQKGKKFSFRLYYSTDRKGQSVFKSRRDIKGHEFHYWESTQDENELKMQQKSQQESAAGPASL